ncbi:hypothetical protein K439DRAFT_935652 [Ramaria rubella]|nr:hypothetical protein K439DRAFT_935652 [Ramaria rubella]
MISTSQFAASTSLKFKSPPNVMSRYFIRLWQTIRKERRMVGRDLEGNRFYETVLGDNAPLRTRRTVEYKKTGDLWDTASGISGLPAQWSAWLSHTRTDPPTLDELKNDLARRGRIAINVAHLKAQEEEELRRVQAAAVQPPHRIDLSPVNTEPQTWAPQPARRD